MFGRKRQLKIALAALHYYADETTWKRRGKHRNGDPVKYARAPFTTDHGKRARQALGLISKPTLVMRLLGRQPVDLGEFRATVPAPAAARRPDEVQARAMYEMEAE